MKVSVIIPVHNRQSYIATAIRSLLRQRNDADLDIIVVDDGSTDRTPEIVSALAVQEGCIRLIRQEKAGVTHARNTGLDHIHPHADFVTFLDSDDVSVMGRFDEELAFFRDDPDLSMTYSRMIVTENIDDERFVPEADSPSCTLHGISLTTAIFKRDAVAKVGRFDERLHQAEDLDFLLRFFELSLKYRMIENISVLYRRHPDNTTKKHEEAKRARMHAVLLSIQRRRKDPSLQNIPKFFDLSGFANGQNASLR